MNSRGKNEGIRVLDDFVCEAIPAAADLQTQHTANGNSETRRNKDQKKKRKQEKRRK